MRLLVAGASDQINSFQEMAVSTVRRFAHRPVVIAGYGRAGEAAASALAKTNTPVVIVDRETRPPVDTVGDVRDPQVLEAAEIEEAAATIIAVDDDTTAIFATLIMRELNPDLYIIVRANREEDEQKLYRAGADYVQSLATVSGRMMASTILEDERVFTFGAQIEIVQLPAGDLVGQTLAECAVQNRAGVTVLAVVREGDTLTDLDPHAFQFQPEDAVIVAGTSTNVRRFESEFLS
jgi:Trk K+ transport system NAD-binding subunit